MLKTLLKLIKSSVKIYTSNICSNICHWILKKGGAIVKEKEVAIEKDYIFKVQIGETTYKNTNFKKNSNLK